MADDTHPYGLWLPWSPQDVAAFFASVAVPWWISGGWAIDLFLGRQTRPHDDVDVQVLRQHQHEIRGLFAGWDMQAVAPAPAPREWPFYEWESGHVLRPETHDIWCRPSKTAPWAIQLMIADTWDTKWVFRRLPEIARPITTIGCRTVDGIPYLSPDIQLLYKAKGMRPKDVADFWHALPHLDRGSRRWLQRALAIAHPDHPWLESLRDG